MTPSLRHRGVVVPLATPFTAEGQIDDAATRRLVEHLASNEIGVFVLGTTGETASIPHRERRRFVETAVEAASGRVPVYAGIGDNCVPHSIEGAEHYLDSGVQGVVAHLPSYYPLSAREMQRYFKLLHDNIKGDLLIYNIPQTTYMSIPHEVIEALAELPRVVGFKDSERDMNRAHETARRCGARPDFALFMGSAVLSVEAMRLGYDGLVPSSGNIVPDLWRKLWEAGKAEDWETAETLQTRADEIAMIFQGGRTLGQSIAALKACLHIQGICEPHVLPPLEDVSDADLRQLRKHLGALVAPL
jgi:4-hydroxy-tetrahydrodipicolinate synthase